MHFIPKKRPLLHKTPSYWDDNTQYDLAIIGAGITGSMVAFFLEQLAPSMRIVLIEKEPSPYGATTRNAGFACFGSVSEFLDDKHEHGEDYAVNLMIKRINGLSILQDVFRHDDIGWKNNGGVEFFTTKDMYDECVEAVPNINQYIENTTINPFKVKVYDSKEYGLSKSTPSIVNQSEASVDSGLMLASLHHKLRYSKRLFGCHVTDLNDVGTTVEITTSHFNLRAKQVLVATNGFTKSLIPDLNVLPNRGQILVTSPIPEFSIRENIHYDRGYFYARQLHDKRILIGGGRHLDRENEQTDVMETTMLIQESLERVLKNVILPKDSKFTIDYRWAGIMAFGRNNEKEPIVGYKGNIHHIVRMGGMGIALAPVIARDWAKVFTESN